MKGFWVFIKLDVPLSLISVWKSQADIGRSEFLSHLTGLQVGDNYIKKRENHTWTASKQLFKLRCSMHLNTFSHGFPALELCCIKPTAKLCGGITCIHAVRPVSVLEIAQVEGGRLEWPTAATPTWYWISSGYRVHLHCQLSYQQADMMQWAWIIKRMCDSLPSTLLFKLTHPLNATL